MLRPLTRPTISIRLSLRLDLARHHLHQQTYHLPPALFPAPKKAAQYSTAAATAESRKKTSGPLRILFCGSDGFSCASLRALHGEHVRNGELVESLEVMVLPGKRTGRGLKEVREVPCKALAQELGLKIHQRETFRNWNLPNGINLVVVVSFGLFVPPRILKAAKYGGLNVHPSLLPDLRGPAPIHHALLRGDTHVGISLQTLHPQTFDHGTILAQTPPPGLRVPRTASLQRLSEALGAAGAEMLVQGLRDGVHVAPHVDAGWMAARLRGEELVHAPKVSKADAQVDWAGWDSEAVRRRVRVFGMVWTRIVNDKGEVKRVLFLQDGQPYLNEDVEGKHVRGKKGKILFLQDSGQEGNDMERHEKVVKVDDATGEVLIPMAKDGEWMRVMRVKVDGKPEQAAATGLRPYIHLS